MKCLKCENEKRKNPFVSGLFCPKCQYAFYSSEKEVGSVCNKPVNEINKKQKEKRASIEMIELFHENQAKARMKTVEGIGNIQGCFLVIGDAGTGKTHSAYAQYHEWLTYGVYTNIEVLQSVEFFEKLKASYNKKENILSYYENLTYLAIDDLGTEKPSEWSLSILDFLIDHRGKLNKPTTITTNLNMEQIEEMYGSRVKRRLGSLFTVINL